MCLNQDLIIWVADTKIIIRSHFPQFHFFELIL